VKDREHGQARVEYALILVLIAVVVIGALLLLEGQIKGDIAQRFPRKKRGRSAAEPFCSMPC
jgi:Flp pilus assembly pilin Flp